jgi:hypothetical protein
VHLSPEDTRALLLRPLQVPAALVVHITVEESAKMGVAEWIIIMVIVWAFWYCGRKTS